MANKENIRKWVEALRSGEFEQAKERLSDGRGYCCLGVACEIAIRNGVNIEKKVEQGSRAVSYDGDVSELPIAAAEWLELVEESDYSSEYSGLDYNPQLKRPDGVTYAAAEWNDEQNLSFAEIADLIELNFLTTSTTDVG